MFGQTQFEGHLGVTFPRWKVYCICLQLCFFTSSCSLNPAHWAFKSLCWCSWPYLLTGLHCWDKGLWNKADLHWLKKMGKLTGHPRSFTARGQQSCDMNSHHCCQAWWSSTLGLSPIWYKSTSHPKVNLIESSLNCAHLIFLREDIKDNLMRDHIFCRWALLLVCSHQNRQESQNTQRPQTQLSVFPHRFWF